MDFMLTVEEARVHLKEQLTARKEMNERCAVLRDKLDESEQVGGVGGWFVVVRGGKGGLFGFVVGVV